MVEVNTIAPDFTLSADNGEEVTLHALRGKKVIIYFYPKDNTPGCTKEACSFRDAYDEFMEKGAVVLGISPDSAGSHQKFRSKYNLQFFLLSDTEHHVAEIYGAWGEKSMYGKKYMGMLRSTFIVDENGVIIKVFKKVKPDHHAEEIKNYL